MGYPVEMMKAVLVFAVMLAVANAHWTHDDSLAIEIGAPPGEKMPAGLVENSLSLVEEKAKSGSGPVVYRITVGTKQESADNAATNSPWSTHKFQINIEGVGGQKTGNMQIRYYAPSLSYGAASGGASSMPRRSILAWSQQIASQTQATVESFSLAVAKQSTKETVMASSSMARSSRARKLENSRLSPSQR